MCSLRAQSKRLFTGRLTDSDDDLKVVHHIEVCLGQKKKAWVNFWIASVNGQLRRKSFILHYIAGLSTLFTSGIKKGFAKGEAFCSNLTKTHRA